MLRGERDRAIGLDRLRGLDGLADHLVERDGVALERAPVVEAREEQEVVDEEAHALRLAADPAHRALEVVRPLGRAAAVELRIGAHRGERRPQLVRRVGDEPAQLALGRLLRAERRLDRPEHGVERVPQPADLGAVVVALDAAREVAAGDRRGRPADVVERTEADPDEPQPEGDERPQDDEGHDDLDRDQPVQGRVDLVEGRRDDEHRLGALLQRGPDAVGAARPGPAP